MEGDGRIAQVSGAYENTAKTLIGLHDEFRRGEDPTAECVSIWQTLSETTEPTIVVQPGIVIGNYWPEGDPKPEAKDGEMAQCADTFARNGHREELERNGVRIHEVGPDHEGSTLPLLLPVEVSA